MTIRNEPVFPAVILSRVRQSLPAGPYLEASRRVRRPAADVTVLGNAPGSVGKGRQRVTARKTLRLSTVSS